MPPPPQANPETMEGLITHIRHGNESGASLQQRFGDRITESAEALYRLGDRFAREGNAQPAIKAYEHSIAKEPGKDNLTALANLHLSQGDEAGWLKTMKRRLDLPFDRRNDADTNHDIAAYFIDQGEWEKALPYAEAAAMRGYWWDYRQAAWLNAALGNTQRGQKWLEQEQARWGTSVLQTYILAFDSEPSDWTLDLLDNFYSRFSQGSVIERARCSSIALLREDYDAAAGLMEQGLQQRNDPWYGLHAALICEEQGWMERRDKILQTVAERWPRFSHPNRNRTNARAFVDLYIQANQQKRLSDELKMALQHLFDTCGRGESAFNGAYVGELCRLKGAPEMAKAMHSEIIDVTPLNNISDYVAFRGLRLLGEDPVNILQEQRKKQAQHKGITP